jgi:hypothetical protein
VGEMLRANIQVITRRRRQSERNDKKKNGRKSDGNKAKSMI